MQHRTGKQKIASVKMIHLLTLKSKASKHLLCEHGPLCKINRRLYYNRWKTYIQTYQVIIITEQVTH
jgi:hypothetical protein